MQPVSPVTIQNQIPPITQKEVSEAKNKSVETPGDDVKGSLVNGDDDVVSLSTQQVPAGRRTSISPSIPVSHAEMKALYKAFSVRV